MPTTSYDALILGAGQAGVPLSRALAGAGWKVALVERAHVGGTCVNEGCTPTKTMVASARVAHLARRGADYGVRTGPISVDLVRVRQRKRDIVASFRGGSQRRIEKTPGVELVFGEAVFTGPKTVQAGGRTLTADKIFLNVGARAAVPDVPGIADVPMLDNASIMELDAVPEHLMILGGGYVGVEFGQMFRRFGSRVTIVQRGGQLLGREDPDVAEEVAKILREDGIEIHLQSDAARVEPSGGGIRMTVKTPGGERTVEGSHLLAAAGRRPNTDLLSPSAAGIKIDERGFIPVNERLETNVEGIYALGDVTGGPAFTHISYDDFRIIRTNLIEGGSATTGGRMVPYVVFIDPQLGRIGMTEEEARKKHNVRVAKLPMAYVARALETDETRGFMKAVVDADTHQILGAAILGIEGGEVMSVVQMAMMGKVPYQRLRDGVFAHPTLSESLNNLFMAMDND